VIRRSDAALYHAVQRSPCHFFSRCCAGWEQPILASTIQPPRNVVLGLEMLAEVLEQLLNQTDFRISFSMPRPKIRVNDSRRAPFFS